jgi:hypothetical protein
MTTAVMPLSLEGVRSFSVWMVVFGCACGRIAFDPTAPSSDAAASIDALTCPASYMLREGACYRQIDIQMTWLEAEAICEADGPGAHLAVVLDEAEHLRLMAIITSLPVVSTHWIGATDRITHMTVLTVTGLPALVDPNDGNQFDPGEDCWGLRPNISASFPNGTFADDNCDTRLDRVLCEYDGVPVVPGSY